MMINIGRLILGAWGAFQACVSVASQDCAQECALEKAPAYSSLVHAGLMMAGDEPFEKMVGRWREEALSFESRRPRPVFDQDCIPPFLSFCGIDIPYHVTLSLESHWWTHKRHGTWYVIPNHSARVQVPVDAPVKTMVEGPMRHTGFGDRGVYGYEVKVSFGGKPISFSLYAPFLPDSA